MTSTSGDIIIVPAKFEVKPRVSIPSPAEDHSTAELLLIVPDAEIGMHLALDPMLHIYDRHIDFGVSRPDEARWRKEALGRSLVRNISLDDTALSEVIVDSKTMAVVADCPRSYGEGPTPICNVVPFAVGGFDVELSLAISDLARYRDIQRAIAQWLSKYHHNGPANVRASKAN